MKKSFVAVSIAVSFAVVLLWLAMMFPRLGIYIYIYLCPLKGKCLITNVVYQAEVVETKADGQEEVEKYVGCTTDFKTRWRHHDKSFNNPDYKHETVLSTHIWEAKSRGSTWKVNWKILDRAQPFNPVTKICKLCVRERFFIIRKPHLASLNHRQEIGTFCPHVRSSLLRNIKKVKAPD